MTINGQMLFVIVRNEIRKEDRGVLIDLIVLFKGGYCSFLFIVKYVSADTVQTLKLLRINCLGTSGNCYIQVEDFLIYVSGQKVQQKQRANQAKAFQEFVIKLLFQPSSDPDSPQPSYQGLTELANISIGLAGNIMTELEDERFILRTKAKRVLKDKPDLFEHWITAYHDVLRPRLPGRQMRFSKKEH